MKVLCKDTLFVIRASSFLRASQFVIRHSSHAH